MNPDKLLSARQRAVLYTASVGLAAGYAVAEANTELPWPVQATYAAWNAVVGVLALTNTPRTAATRPGQAGR